MKLKHTKPLSFKNYVHTDDENTIIDFLNEASKTIGALKNLGSFVDTIKIINEFGIKANLKIIFVERELFSRESPGKNHEYYPDEIEDIFDIYFNLPNFFPEKPSEKKSYAINSTVQNHSCNPKQKCSKCNASGRCVNCEGSGTKSCSSCKGTGKTEKRDGSYANGNPKYKKVACYSCDGRGRNSCRSCSGSGKCGKCGGIGEVTCSRCDGTSIYQSYKVFSEQLIPFSENFYFSDYKQLENIIPKSKNNIVFDDTLIEWQDQNNILLDNKESAIKANKYSNQMIKYLNDLAPLNSNQKVGKILASIETVPISFINFSFEDKKYQIIVLGEDNIVCYNEIPKKHSYKVNFFKRILNYFTKTKRQIAFIYIASYMFNSDGSMDSSEKELLQLFLNNSNLSKKEKDLLINKLKEDISIEELSAKIKIIKSDLRALVFAWQCVMQDGQINQIEEDAFIKLSKFFNVNKEEELEKIKHKAKKFAKLKDNVMLEEYFKS